MSVSLLIFLFSSLPPFSSTLPARQEQHRTAMAADHTPRRRPVPRPATALCHFERPSAAVDGARRSSWWQGGDEEAYQRPATLPRAPSGVSAARHGVRHGSPRCRAPSGGAEGPPRAAPGQGGTGRCRQPLPSCPLEVSSPVAAWRPLGGGGAPVG